MAIRSRFVKRNAVTFRELRAALSSVINGKAHVDGDARSMDEHKMKTASVWQKMAATAAIGFGVCSLSGCNLVNGAFRALTSQECLDDFLIGFRNSAMATQAWNRVKHRYRNHPYLNDFKAGFYAGYGNVAGGGAGCCPSIAPKEYWGWKYQSPIGQAAVNAWFQGFPHGARAAEEDGVGYWGAIPTNLKQPQPIHNLGLAPVYGTPDGMTPDAANPFLPEPIPPGIEAEENIEPLEDMAPGLEPSGEAIERALERALDADDSVYDTGNDIPMANDSTGDQLVPKWSLQPAAPPVSAQIADRRNGVMSLQPADGRDQAESISDTTAIERVFGGPVNAPSGAEEDNDVGGGELPYSFE